MRLPPAITSRTNARVKALRTAFAGRASAPGELTAIEGEHLLAEAGQRGLFLEALFVRQGNEALLDLPSLKGLRAREYVVLSREVFDAVMDTASPQGIAATLPIPVVEPDPSDGADPVLLLENVQDPGNVGTLIRSAVAFGAAMVLLVGECPNAWSAKVLRSSAGAVFRVPVIKLTLKEAKTLSHERQWIAAVPRRRGAVVAMEARLDRSVLMIGNEGRGLTAEALALADQRVTIPCRVESFNAAVAGSLLLYEAFRQAFVQGQEDAPAGLRSVDAVPV